MSPQARFELLDLLLEENHRRHDWSTVDRVGREAVCGQPFDERGSRLRG
jgi:hypothetical protein